MPELIPQLQTTSPSSNLTPWVARFPNPLTYCYEGVAPVGFHAV